MARAMWSGTLSFGLVTVPVALYSATEDHSVRFRQLQRGTSDRVRNQRVNERTGEEVEYSDVVKGYELTEGEYVVIEPHELDELAPGRSRTIEIIGFVELGEVEPILFDKTYYLGPKGKEYTKVYALLREALGRTGKAGIAKFSMRGREYLTAVHAEGDTLTLHTMHFADEIRDPRQEVDNLPETDVTVQERELKAAEQLVEMLAMDWDPKAYRDEYEDRVRELVEAKVEGKEIVRPESTVAATNVVDLMDALNRSMAAAGGTPKPAEAETGEDGLDGLTKAQLYEKASELKIPHRSTMTRDELRQAVRQATAPAGGKRRLKAVS
ncbi:Ku protein [Kitasatospora sp. NPDC101801]|uniref:non-homologous end joining protein Ku n=1 Tax=Kitasatospora sp. NPDC101801 TaxID=3364103 RepID=UPI00382E06C8